MSAARRRRNGPATREPAWVRALVLAIVLAFLGLLLLLPLVLIFREALKDGLGAFWAAVSDDDTLAALELTALTVAVVVPLNLVLGTAAAWALGRFRFRGRTTLISLFDLPLAVSPVIAGMSYMLLFGARGLFRPLLDAWEVDVVFAPPGIILATSFVTFPFVARELIPFWEAQGNEEEEAALVLGAGAWTMFRRVSLPNAKWAMLYGVVLTSARAMGEFGAVSVVSGHIRGETNTLPLHIEVLYGDYRFTAAFAVASLLALSGLVNLALKKLLEGRVRAQELPDGS